MMSEKNEKNNERKTSGIPMTEEQIKIHHKAFSDIEDCIKYVEKYK